MAPQAAGITVERVIRKAPSPVRGWGLVEWCLAHAGNEFSLQFMGLAGEEPAAHARLKSELAAFHRGAPNRERVTAPAGENVRRPTDVWILKGDSLAALRRCLPTGLFASPSYDVDGWFEDFTIYRGGEIMLGVVSHEGHIFLRLTESEYGELHDWNVEMYAKTN
jgi:hypothetical protein